MTPLRCAWVSAGAILLLLANSAAAERTRVWIDTDPSIGPPWREVDDAFALLLAFRSPELEIVGISSTYGNAGVQRTTSVATDLARRFGGAVAVYRGASSPRDAAVRTPATDALARALGERKLTYIALGPLTNLAALLSLHPKLARNIERVVIVGGQSPGQPPGFGPARSHRIHDANVFKDPASAAAVLKSGRPVTLAAIDVARQLALTRNDLEQLRGSGPAGDFLFKKTRAWFWFWTRYVGEEGGLIFDALAIVPMIRSDLVQVERRFAEVDRGGNMVAYRERRANAQPVQFSTRVSSSAKPLLIRRLSGRTENDGVTRR